MWTPPPGKFSALDYSRLPITRTFQGNRKKVELSGVRVIGSSKKIAGSRVKNVFYWLFYSPVIVEMLISNYESHVTKHSLNWAFVLRSGEVMLFYVRFMTKKKSASTIYLQQINDTSKSNVSDASTLVFPYFLRNQNMFRARVRVIGSQLYYIYKCRREVRNLDCKQRLLKRTNLTP